MRQLWAFIPGFNERYIVGSWSDIRSVRYYNKKNKKASPHLRGIILSCYRAKNGYLYVSLQKEGKKRMSYLLHRLIALALLPNPESKSEVNHKNGIKTDNRVENLEWVTRAENIKHAKEYGLLATGIHPPHRKILQIHENGTILNIYKSLAETQRNGYNKNEVSRACRGKRPNYHGFNWAYDQNGK